MPIGQQQEDQGGKLFFSEEFWGIKEDLLEKASENLPPQAT